ncbi:MAG: hypothetical protein A2632_01395 [Candidatus Pacebacteria bacterium RIFCSPHIGHO2_01_FULL_46_16]|nr:MAG: hypothetical protein A2632_01395 [Candidatus Pacebacteria bacterium RIFCSPHIGHO2_01_FULL_46_16]
MKTTFFLLVCFLVLAIPRIWQLGTLPLSLNRDEAALAYNAVLLAETGKDEWGRSWPLALQSFGDFKLIGYPAVLAGLFSLVPANDFWVRLPAAVAGLSLPLLAFWFARLQKMEKTSARLFALLVLTAPVFFFFSRMAFEAMLGTSLFLTGLCFWLQFSQTNQVRFGIFSLLFFVLASLTYNTPLLLWLLLLPALPFFLNKKNRRPGIFLILLSGVLIGGLFFSLRSVIGQKTGITIFSDETVWAEYVLYRSQFSEPFIFLVGNQFVFFILQALERLLATFSWLFLVELGGTHPWHALPDWGHIFAVEYWFGLLGIGRLLRDVIRRTRVRPALFVLLLLVASLLPAIITVDAPHATRSLLFFFLFLFCTVLGFERVCQFMRHRYRKIITALFVIVIGGSFAGYVQDYFTTHLAFEPGLSEVLNKQVRFDDTVAVIDGSGYQYIIFSWYAQITPETYFATVVRQLPDKIGFRYGERVGQFHFIANSQDRTSDERILLEWSGSEWVITRY